MEQVAEVPPELLVGHGRTVQGPLTVDWAFHENHTFSGSVARGVERISDFVGRWALEQTRLLSEYTNDSAGDMRFPLGGPGEFVYHFCAPHAVPAAVGEARRSIIHKTRAPS